MSQPDREPTTTHAAIELAALTIETLDAQRRYFKHRDTGDLATCRALENRLRRLAEAVLNTPEPMLF